MDTFVFNYNNSFIIMLLFLLYLAPATRFLLLFSFFASYSWFSEISNFAKIIQNTWKKKKKIFKEAFSLFIFFFSSIKYFSHQIFSIMLSNLHYYLWHFFFLLKLFAITLQKFYKKIRFITNCFCLHEAGSHTNLLNWR